MTARKSLPGRSSRYSRYSIQSQLSGVLNPDSNLISDDEANPLWFKEFENQSIRPSARFSLARDDTPILDSNSEPESTPLQKDWWKHVKNTPHFRPSRQNVTKERSDAREKSNVEASDTSSLEESIGKKRVHPLRRSKRKVIEKNNFSDILDATKDSTASENIAKNRRSKEKQDTFISSSESDISIEKVRRQPFGKKIRAKRVSKSLNIESSSDGGPPEEFQDALDGSQSPNESGRRKAPDNIFIEPVKSLEEKASPANSPDNPEPVGQQVERKSSEKRNIAAVESKDDLEGSRSPVLMSRTKKRTRFTKTTNRKTANFDDLLNNASEGSIIAEQSSVREIGEVATNQNDNSKETATQFTRDSGFSTRVTAKEGESESEDSLVRRRVPFVSKKRKNRKEESFTKFLASPDTSIHSELLSPRKQSEEHEFLEPEAQRPDVERRSSKRRSNIVEENRSATKLSRSSNSINESVTGRRSRSKKMDNSRISQISKSQLEDNESAGISTRLSSVGTKSGADRNSKSGINSRAEISQHSDIDLENNESLDGGSRPSDKDSTNKETYRVQVSAPLIVELQANQAVGTPIRLSSNGDKSVTEKRSMNKTRDNEEKRISNDSQLNENRSSPRAGDTSRRVQSEENEGEEEISTNIEDPAITSGVNDPSQRDEQYSNDSISQIRNANSINKETTTLADLVDKTSADETNRVSSKNRRSTTVQNLEIGTPPLQEHNREATRVKNRSVAADGIENTEILESEITGVGTITQSSVNRTERSFSSVDQTGARSMQADASVGIESQSLNTEKMLQIKNALEEVKKKELALMKNTRIDSYFKKVSGTKQDDAVKNSSTSQKKTKPGENQRKKTATTSPSKAYLVNGKVYKRPHLPRPKYWATDRLYNFLWKKLEPKYKLRTRIRSEKFVINMSQVVAVVVRRQKYENYKKELENLIQDMARLGIIKTRNDFHIFCRDFLPYEFRVKVIPMLLPGNVRNIPFNPDELHTPILSS